MYKIRVSFNCTRAGERITGQVHIENSTPVGPDKLRAVVMAQEELAPRIEERERVERVVITDLEDL